MSQKLSDKLAASVRGAKQSSEVAATQAVTAVTAEAVVAPKAVKEVEAKLVAPVLSARRVWPD